MKTEKMSSYLKMKIILIVIQYLIRVRFIQKELMMHLKRL